MDLCGEEDRFLLQELCTWKLPAIRASKGMHKPLAPKLTHPRHTLSSSIIYYLSARLLTTVAAKHSIFSGSKLAQIAESNQRQRIFH